MANAPSGRSHQNGRAEDLSRLSGRIIAMVFFISGLAIFTALVWTLLHESPLRDADGFAGAMLVAALLVGYSTVVVTIRASNVGLRKVVREFTPLFRAAGAIGLTIGFALWLTDSWQRLGFAGWTQHYIQVVTNFAVDEGRRAVLEKVWLAVVLAPLLVGFLGRGIRRGHGRITNLSPVLTPSLWAIGTLLGVLLFTTSGRAWPTAAPWPADDPTSYMEEGYNFCEIFFFLTMAFLLFFSLVEGFGRERGRIMERLRGAMARFVRWSVFGCMAFSVLACYFLAVSFWRAGSEASTIKTMASISHTKPDGEYSRILERVLRRLNMPPVRITKASSVGNIGNGELYAIEFSSNEMGELLGRGAGLGATYEHSREDGWSLGEEAQWDALFTISVTMTLASHRLSRISEIRYDASVSDASGNKALYSMSVDPRSYGGRAYSRDDAERYARAIKTVLTDTATGKVLVSEPSYRGR